MPGTSAALGGARGRTEKNLILALFLKVFEGFSGGLDADGGAPASARVQKGTVPSPPPKERGEGISKSAQPADAATGRRQSRGLFVASSSTPDNVTITTDGTKGPERDCARVWPATGMINNMFHQLMFRPENDGNPQCCVF